MRGASSTTASTSPRSRTSRTASAGWSRSIRSIRPSTPKKRTALGRAKHEGAAGIINSDGRYVVYTGDDERFDYVYRFVTTARVDRANPQANRDILDDGVLSVARYNADGTRRLAAAGARPGTADRGQRLREPGRCADRDCAAPAISLGATKMDRPEDVEANPVTQKVYVILTNNGNRKPEQIDAANPRAVNHFGHIIEMIPPGGDHAAAQFRWEMLVKCGDPSIADVGASFSADTTQQRLVRHAGQPRRSTARAVCGSRPTDNAKSTTGRADGLWGVETEGPARGTSRHFYRVPVGAELCGPCFTPDDETLFVAVQHPAEEESSGEPSTFEEPSTRWPDFKPDMPPRPSVVAITKRGGGKIAS